MRLNAEFYRCQQKIIRVCQAWGQKQNFWRYFEDDTRFCESKMKILHSDYQETLGSILATMYNKALEINVQNFLNLFSP